MVATAAVAISAFKLDQLTDRADNGMGIERKIEDRMGED